MQWNSGWFFFTFFVVVPVVLVGLAMIALRFWPLFLAAGICVAVIVLAGKVKR